MAVKNGQIGYNEITSIPIFHAYTLGFSVAILSSKCYLSSK